MSTFLFDVSSNSVRTTLFSGNIFEVTLLLLLAVILIVAGIFRLFKDCNFGKTLLGSSFANAILTDIRYLRIDPPDALGRRASSSGEWLIFYTASVLIEGIVLMLFYSRLLKEKLWSVTVVMNPASYIFYTC